MTGNVVTVPTLPARPTLTLAESRNLKVVALLIASMTVGGGLLLALEAPRPGWSHAPLLAAERSDPVSGLTIELLPTDAAAMAEYDCVLLPDGECRWQPRGSEVRLALLSAADGHLTDVQVRKLLELLGSLSQTRGLNLSSVRLDANSDPRIVGDLGPVADELVELLVRKGIIS